jgi:hypothetical protein
MSRSPEEGPADCLSIPSPALSDWKPCGALNLVVLKIVSRGSGRDMSCSRNSQYCQESLSEQSRSGGPQSEAAPTANDRGPFPVSVPKPLGAAIALGMAGWVTSVPASLGQFNQPIGGSSISPKIESTQFTHEGSARQAGWAGLGSIVATRIRRRRHERQPNMRAV